MALPLRALLAALLTVLPAALVQAAGCPYQVSLKRNGDKWEPLKPPRPLPADQCAFMQGLEEPYRRIVAAASLPEGSVPLSQTILDWNGDFNAAYGGSAVFVTDAFASCMKFDQAAAIQILCHEMGHAVQHISADEGTRQAYDKIIMHAPKTRTEESAAAERDLERHADRVGRELCTRAGYSQDFELLAKALMRCTGSRKFHDLDNHPSNDERLAAALADKPRLSRERGRQIGAAIQRRARRLLAGQPTIEDELAYDPNQTPREWALTPYADKDRLRDKYQPSATYSQVHATSPDRLPPPPAPAPAARVVPVSSGSGGWLDVLKDWLSGGR